MHFEVHIGLMTSTMSICKLGNHASKDMASVKTIIISCKCTYIYYYTGFYRSFYSCCCARVRHGLLLAITTVVLADKIGLCWESPRVAVAVESETEGLLYSLPCFGCGRVYLFDAKG